MVNTDVILEFLEKTPPSSPTIRKMGRRLSGGYEIAEAHRRESMQSAAAPRVRRNGSGSGERKESRPPRRRSLFGNMSSIGDSIKPSRRGSFFGNDGGAKRRGSFFGNPETKAEQFASEVLESFNDFEE